MYALTIHLNLFEGLSLILHTKFSSFISISRLSLRVILTVSPSSARTKVEINLFIARPV